jgi:hypothetical protein
MENKSLLKYRPSSGSSRHGTVRIVQERERTRYIQDEITPGTVISKECD